MVENFNSAKDLIKNSQNILISISEEINLGDFCGALALFYTLKELGKNVNLISPQLPEKIKFLADGDILNDSGQNNILISVKTKRGEINKIFYEKNPQELKFYLNLKEGEIELENVSFKVGGRSFDLMIVLNDKNLVFNPVGQKDRFVLYDYSSSGTCQMVNLFLKSFEENLIKDRVATCLLAGLMTLTQSLQNSEQNPDALKEASLLSNKGADYQMIIKNFYKTNSLPQINLLNKVFSKLIFDEEKDVAFCSLSDEDFKKSGASSLDLAFVLETLKLNFTLPKTIFLLWENLSSPFIVKGVFYGPDESLIKKLSENFEAVAKKNSALFLIRGVNLKKAEEKILSLIN